MAPLRPPQGRLLPSRHTSDAPSSTDPRSPAHASMPCPDTSGPSRMSSRDAGMSTIEEPRSTTTTQIADSVRPRQGVARPFFRARGQLFTRSAECAPQPTGLEAHANPSPRSVCVERQAEAHIADHGGRGFVHLLGIAIRLAVAEHLDTGCITFRGARACRAWPGKPWGALTKAQDGPTDLSPVKPGAVMGSGPHSARRWMPVLALLCLRSPKRLGAAKTRQWMRSKSAEKVERSVRNIRGHLFHHLRAAFRAGARSVLR